MGSPTTYAFTLILSEHSGTHVDATAHFVDGGKKWIDEMPLETFIGPCCVITATSDGPNGFLRANDVKAWEERLNDAISTSTHFLVGKKNGGKSALGYYLHRHLFVYSKSNGVRMVSWISILIAYPRRLIVCREVLPSRTFLMWQFHLDLSFECRCAGIPS